MIGLRRLCNPPSRYLAAKPTVAAALVALFCLGPAPAITAVAAPRHPSHRQTWTGALQTLLRRCEKIPQPPAGRAQYWRRLRLMQGAVGWRRWLRTFSAAQREKLATAIKVAGARHLVRAVFSPARRDRAMAAAKLAAIAAPWSGALLNVLLADRSRYVRLCTMNALWRHAPDGPGTADLLWLAVETRGRTFAFHSRSRTWSPVPSQAPSVMHVRVGGSRVSVAITPSPLQETFCGADRRRAADLLIHWHSSALTGLLLRAGHQQKSLSAIVTVPVGSPMTLFSQSTFLRIFRRCRPAAAAPYLLRWINATGGGASVLAPQGWSYFRSSRTWPLCLLMLESGLNPAHFGIVKIGCSAASFRAPAICEFSRRQEAVNLARMRRWCQVRHILPAKRSLPANIPAANMMGLPADRGQKITLTDMELGLMGWFTWTGHLPVPQRQAMLAWGPKHVQIAAMAFASGIKLPMTAARLLSPGTSAPAQKILLHLIRSPAEAVALGAVNAFWPHRPSAATVAAVQRLAHPHAHALAMAAPTWTLVYHGRRLIIPRHFRHQPFWQKPSPQGRIWLLRLLQHWKRR